MDAIQAGRLLATCASYDNRSESTAATLAWAKALADLDYADCDRAVTDHYAETDAWIMPSHIRARVRAMRADRIERTRIELSDAAADDVATYLRELRTGIRAAADGPRQRPAIGGAR